MLQSLATDLRLVSAATALSLCLAGCGSPEAPGIPLNLSGSWRGSGADSQGSDSLTLFLTQADSSISGAVFLRAADSTDGSCASCHKHKAGTVSGAISRGALTMTMVFPTGGDTPTPLCSVTIHASSPDATGKQIAANYSGSDSCEGPFGNGAFTMVRR